MLAGTRTLRASAVTQVDFVAFDLINWLVGVSPYHSLARIRPAVLIQTSAGQQARALLEVGEQAQAREEEVTALANTLQGQRRVVHEMGEKLSVKTEENARLRLAEGVQAKDMAARLSVKDAELAEMGGALAGRDAVVVRLEKALATSENESARLRLTSESESVRAGEQREVLQAALETARAELGDKDEQFARLKLSNQTWARVVQETEKKLAGKNTEITRLAQRLAAQEDVHAGEMGEVGAKLLAKEQALERLRLEYEALKMSSSENEEQRRALTETEATARVVLAGRDEDVERLRQDARQQAQALLEAAEGGGAARAALAARDGEIEGLRLAAGVREGEVADTENALAEQRRVLHVRIPGRKP